MEIENSEYDEEISNEMLPKVFNNCTFKNCKFRITIYVKAKENQQSKYVEPRFLDNEEEWQTQEENTLEQEETLEETPAKTPEAQQEKKRGRPKGSKNKKKAGNVKIKKTQKIKVSK